MKTKTEICPHCGISFPEDTIYWHKKQCSLRMECPEPKCHAAVQVLCEGRHIPLDSHVARHNKAWEK
jgi:hypothetical protein